MARNIYKGGATSIAFNTGGSRYQELNEIRRQRKDEVDAIKLAQFQADKIAQDKIGSIKGNQKLTTSALLEGQKLEAKVRSHQYEALSKFAQTDVARLQGEADAKLKYANYLKDLAPKAAEAAGKIARGGLMFADKLVGIAEWNSDEVQGKLKRQSDAFIEQHWKLQKGINTDATTLTEDGDIDGANSLLENIKVSSYWAQKKVLKHITDNQAGYKAEIIEHYNNTYGLGPVDKPWNNRYDENNAVEVMDFGARNLLAQLGIPERSAVGREIINKFRTWGSLDANKHYEARKVEESDALLANLRGAFITAKSGTPEKEQAWNSLVLANKNAWKKVNNTIINPNTSPRLWSDAIIESAKELITENYGKDADWDSLEDINAQFPFLSHPTSKEKKRVPIQDKFAGRWEDEVIPHIVELGEKHRLEEDKENQIKGDAKLPAYKKKAIELEEDQTLSEKDKEIKRLDYISEIAKLDIPEKYKAELYRTFDYNWVENKSDASRYVLFRTAILDGDEVTAMKIFNRTKLDDKVKAEMLKGIKVFNTIKAQTGFTSSSQVTEAIKTEYLTITDNAFRGKQLNRQKNLSSDRALSYFTARVLERVQQGETFAAALNAEKELLFNGVDKKEGRYKIKTVNKVQTFENFADTDALNTLSLDEFFYASEKSEQAWNEVKDLDIITIQPEQLADISTTLNGKINLRSLLTDPQYAVKLVPPDTLNTIKDVLIQKATAKKGDLSEIDISSLIPQTVKDIAKVSRMSDVQAMNEIMKSTFGSVKIKDKDYSVLHINKNSQDVSMLLNQGKYVAPKNEDGYNFYNTMASYSGFIPTRPMTRMCAWEDRPVFEAFLSTHNTLISQGWSIEQDGEKVTIDDSNRYKPGSKWDAGKGGFVIHDVKAFTEAGGINQLIKAGYSEDVLSMFGVPTFTNTIKGE